MKDYINFLISCFMQEINRVSNFNYFKTVEISKNAFIMLLFKVQPLDKSFNKRYYSIMNSIDNLTCFKVTFTNNFKLQINNNLDSGYYLLNFKELINNYFILNTKYFKNINFNTTCIVKVDKQQDNTYYNVYLLSRKSLKDFQALVNYTSFKYKFNFNKKERKLIFKLKNNYLSGFKYSYNFFYMLDIQESIKETIKELESINQDLKELDLYYKDLKLAYNYINKKGFKALESHSLKEQIKYGNMLKNNLKELESLQDNYIKLSSKKQELEIQEQELKALESELISSTDKETTLNDYLLQNTYLE